MQTCCRTSALEEEARRARGDANAWAFLVMARQHEEATYQAALREEEGCHVRLKHEANMQASTTEQREKEAARLADLCRPTSPPESRPTVRLGTS
jgi:hypothetical protein